MGGVEGKKDMWKDDYILINLTMPLRDQVCTLCRDTCRQRFYTVKH